MSRLDNIGQNGNDGEFYLVEKVARQIAGDCQDQKLGGKNEGKAYWGLFIQQAIAVIEIVRNFDEEVVSQKMSEKSCDTCLYQGPFNKDECYAEQCNGDMDGWRAKGVKIKKTVVAPDLVPGDFFYHATPKPVTFSLDKLIDDHWQYNKGLIGYCLPYGVDGWETDDILHLVEFAYKQSGKHFWKHCKEHYNIKEEE